MATVRSEPALRVSVVIPAYNAELYIRRTLRSVLTQTRCADEIIVVDDGSTDRTGQIVKTCFPEVQLIRQENSGASAARNAGIQAARHEWIAFLDGDDEWLPHHLEAQMGLLQRNRQLMWSTGNFFYCYCFRRERRDHIRDERVQVAENLLDNREYMNSFFEAYAAGCAGCTDVMVVRKEALLQAGLFDTGLKRHNDDDMWFRLACHWPQIGYCAEPHAIYHTHVPESITKSFDGPQSLSAFLSRLLEYTGRTGRSTEFAPCAARILQYWFNKYLHNESIRQIRPLLNKFSGLLPEGTESTLRLFTINPELTRELLPLLKIVNRRFRLW